VYGFKDTICQHSYKDSHSHGHDKHIRQHSYKEIHPHFVVEKIMAYVEMVLQHMLYTHNPNRRDSSKLKRWSPPSRGWVMVNVDVAVFKEANRMGLGIVVRDHNGDFLAACR
jgi:hypothetical protein